MSRHLILILLSALVALGLAGGCQPAPSPPEPTPMSAAPVGMDSLSVGALVSQSGRFSREGALLLAGYEAWARAANESGGVRVGDFSRPVRLVVRDDRSEPLAALEAVESLVGDERVSLLLGPHSDAITLAAATASERLGALMVASDASSPQVYARGLGMLVSVLPTDDMLFYGLLEVANAVTPRARPIALVLPDEPRYVLAAEGTRRRARELSLDDPKVELYPPATPDIAMSLERAALGRPRLLVIAAPPERVDAIGAQLRQLRPPTDMRAIVSESGVEGLATLASESRRGMLTLDRWTPTLRARGPVFGSASDFASAFERDAGYPATPRVAAAAAAGLALQLGVERAGSDEPSAVRAALAQIDTATFWGRFGWDPNGRSRAARAIVLQMTAERARVVYPREFAEADLLYPATAQDFEGSAGGLPHGTLTQSPLDPPAP
jgi:branched-chain amino acid transport system substrate-binding protein